ncbi:MAG: hypothetical protein FWE47_00150 [Oscillospiraceae bacterium]|nr:hypothetical protein [Oscillospiraceae bacterium]
MEIKKYANLPIDLANAAREIPKQRPFTYITRGSLGDEYLAAAKAHLKDEHLYIILSDTGSPFCNILSTVTGNEYNHASLAFDEALETMVSYNGGNGIGKPGLNREKVQYFKQKSDSKIAVYKLKATSHEQQKILDYIMKIDAEGSSYNVLRVAAKLQPAPNIKICSQFVYESLAVAELQYFSKSPLEIMPMDFVRENDGTLELCYHRTL